MKTLKLRLSEETQEVVIANPSETDWRDYEKVTINQPDMYYRSMEEEQLTVFLEYIDRHEAVGASNDLADYCIKCHIVMVFRCAGADIIHFERTCESHREKVNEALAAMIKQLSQLADMTI